MGEMIERVAAAMYEACYTALWPPEPFDSELRSADDWRAMVRRAILKLREPTEAMLVAGNSASPSDFDEASFIWPAMVDEILR